MSTPSDHRAFIEAARPLVQELRRCFPSLTFPEVMTGLFNSHRLHLDIEAFERRLRKLPDFHPPVA